ncbi:MAG: ferrous iron transport protein B [Cellulosilyticum sp.]|nr:ferrous iron transport protein B [Cellulosilyticum sp.]
MTIKIGLAGNPNSGKTTLFNALTGATQYVGNWPGVTVEKKSGKYKKNKEVEIVDLPGVYSLSPYTLEEVVTRNFVIGEHPDAIINIVDATNIERNLYLTTQILELGVPTVIALNMMDLVRKNGDQLDCKKLSNLLGCPVMEISALKEEGIDAVTEKAVELAKQKKSQNFVVPVMEEVQSALSQIEKIVESNKINHSLPKKWLAIKLFERDEEVIKSLGLSSLVKREVESCIAQCEKLLDDDAESIITAERYAFIGNIVANAVKKAKKGQDTTSDRIDKIVTNRILALPIFALVMWFVYYISVSSLGAIVTDWTNDVLFGEIIQGNVQSFMESSNVAPWLTALVVDGLIGGVGAVLGFVPQIMLLFLLLAILEDCGYMARVAFIMDRVFRRFGLSGKSFIPMLIGSGCGVPGIMASRTLENDKDRKMTIMLTTFIPCGAKLPIIALFAGALFGGASWVAPSVYFMCIAMVIICGIILKNTSAFAGEPAPFVMELPTYHIPSLKGVLIHMWDRGKAFIIKAGTIIFVACGLIWFLQSFNWSLEMVDADTSILASIGNVIAPIFAPLGFGDWGAAVATVTGLIAKENVVATYGVIYGIADATEESQDLLAMIAANFTTVSAYSFMAFNMLCAPCFAAIGAIRREMGSVKWTLITVGFQTITAYLVALIINKVGSAVLLGGSMVEAAIAIAIVICVITGVLLIGKSKLKSSQSIGLEG